MTRGRQRKPKKINFFEFIVIFIAINAKIIQNIIITVITEKRGKAQRDGRPPLSYRRRTFVAVWENLVTMATGIG